MMTGLILAGCAPRGPQRAAEHSTPPSYLRSRGAGVAPSLRPTSADLSVPAAFSYTDSEGETSDCIFYAATDVPVGLVVYLDGDGQSFHSQGNQDQDERSRGGLAGAGGVVEAASARGYDVVSVRSPGDDGTWWLEDQDGKVRYLEETLDYVRCMTVGRVDERLYEYLGADAIAAVQLYINKPMTATTFHGSPQRGETGETVTSELIYYWMVAAQIPFECERWHLNRLFTLIRIAGIKANPDNKRSSADVAAEYRRINEARRKAMQTRG